jgi:hypothetical protein
VGLRAQHFTVPAAPFSATAALLYRGPGAVGELVDPASRLDDMPCGFTNTPSVQARQAALRSLAESVEAWVCRGLFATDEQLQAMYDKAYRALPKVEPLRAVLMRHPRGARYADALPPDAAA